MQKEPILFMTALGGVGYAVFHGHPAGQDCWLCEYRGLAFIGIPVGWWLFLLYGDEEED